MTQLQLENKLAKSYLTLIEKLSPEVKLDMISKISLSLKKKKKESKLNREEYYAGAWESDETPEEFAESIRAGRVTIDKKIEF